MALMSTETPAPAEWAPEAVAATQALARYVARMPGGQIRDGQRTLVAAVAQTMAVRGRCVAKAPVGTGKSMAAAIPAALAEGRTLIVTGTLQLQDQIVGKDLPAVAAFCRSEGLPELTYAAIKGKSNLACVARAQETLAHPRADAKSRQLAHWVVSSVNDGDRAKLSKAVTDEEWATVSLRSADECPGASACPYGDVCHAEMARQRAAESKIVVANMHLLGLHAATGTVLEGEAMGWFDHVIVDEAHLLKGVVASVNGGQITADRIRSLAGLAAAASLVKYERAAAVASDFERAMRDVGPSTVRLAGGAQDRLPVAIALEHVERFAATLLDAARGGNDLNRARVQRKGDMLLRDVRNALDPEAAADFVHWIGNGAYEFQPRRVDRMLATNAWDGKSVTAMTGTLPDSLAGDLGLDVRWDHDEERFERAEPLRIRVDSPFDYQTNSLLYVPEGIPAPNTPGTGWEDAAVAETISMLCAAGGGALILCTSMRMVRRFADALRADPRTRGLDIMSQEDGPKTALLRRFGDDHDSVLVATRGFWQGVDQPGDALRLVVIDRIPFPTPDDPMIGWQKDDLIARLIASGKAADEKAAGPMAFQMLEVPEAATMLAQAAGRLIRTSSDRGAVVVLDVRLLRASTRRALLRDVPMPVTTDRAAVEARLHAWFRPELAA